MCLVRPNFLIYFRTHAVSRVAHMRSVCVCMQSIIQIPEKMIHPLRLEPREKIGRLFFSHTVAVKMEFVVVNAAFIAGRETPRETGEILRQVQPSVVEVRHS